MPRQPSPRRPAIKEHEPLERERFARAVQDFHNAAVRLQHAWDDLVRVDDSAVETPNYPFDEDFAEIVYRTGAWSGALNHPQSRAGLKESALSGIKKGAKVYFGSLKRKTLGVVVKVNRDSVEVEQLDQSGMMIQYPPGTMWIILPDDYIELARTR